MADTRHVFQRLLKQENATIPLHGMQTQKPSRVVMNLSIRIPITTKEIAALIQLQEREESFEYHNKTTAAAAVAAARMRNKIDS